MNQFTKFIYSFSITTIIPLVAFTDAVDIELSQGESALYILDNNGSITFAGTAVSFGFSEKSGAADLVLTPTGRGYSILFRMARLSLLVTLFRSPACPVPNRICGYGTRPSQSGAWFLRQDGAVLTSGGAVFYGENLSGIAVDLEISWMGMGIIYYTKME